MWLTAITWVLFGWSIPFSGCVTHSGYEFAYQETCGPHPPTEWRLECTYIGLAASTLCLVPALVLLIRGHRIGTVVALILVCLSMGAEALAWLFPVLASGLC